MRRGKNTRRVNGRKATFLDPGQAYDPANVAISPPIEPEDTRGDANYIRLVLATIEQAKLDLAHRCSNVACGMSTNVARGRHLRTCPIRIRAGEFLRDIAAGRHFLSGWVQLAAMRSGLDTNHEPDIEAIPLVFAKTPRSMEADERDHAFDDRDPGQPIDRLTEDDAVLV